MQPDTRLKPLRQQPVPGLTSAGAVTDLVVDKLGDDDRVGDEVEDACDHLVKGRHVETQNHQRSPEVLEGFSFVCDVRNSSYENTLN